MFCSSTRETLREYVVFYYCQETQYCMLHPNKQ
jgi:hypothetical protein